jgi:toxin ParE1/3/4
MSRRKKTSPTARVLITERALQDIRDVETYSIGRWGRAAARKYIDGIECALDRIAKEPQLLRQESQFADSLRFYRVQKHVLVFDVQDDVIYLLTVLHTGMDIPNRLVKLQPQLSLETRLLHAKLSRSKRDAP